MPRQAAAFCFQPPLEGVGLQSSAARCGLASAATATAHSARTAVALRCCQWFRRDIKSSNVLLTAEGRAKVADVGLAKVATADYLSSENTAGRMPGTDWLR